MKALVIFLWIQCLSAAGLLANLLPQQPYTYLYKEIGKIALAGGFRTEDRNLIYQVIERKLPVKERSSIMNVILIQEKGSTRPIYVLPPMNSPGASQST